MPAYKLQQRGRGLVELMIAIALGLVIMLAISRLFVANHASNRTVDFRARMEEDARIALNLMSFQLRMSGYGELVSGSSNPLNRDQTTFDSSANDNNEGVQGCSTGFTDPKAGIACNAAGDSKGDAIAIRYVVDLSNSNKTADPIPLPTDCLGQGVLGTPAIVENRYYIGTNSKTGRKELYCAGNGGSQVGGAFVSAGPPIAENVTDMKIEYLVNTMDREKANQQDIFYTMTASQIDAGANGLKDIKPMPDKGFEKIGAISKWQQIYAVKVCLLLQSAEDGVATTPMTYKDCGGVDQVATDRRFYRAFSTTVALRARTLGV